ncbi:MAG: hypothetical protein IJA10_09200 [Lachnospiraceae bacterium]|nr:hypothetical protein [Lachnospiraceae bacterium]
MTDNELLLAISDMLDTKLKSELKPIKEDIRTLKEDVQIGFSLSISFIASPPVPIISFRLLNFNNHATNLQNNTT